MTNWRSDMENAPRDGAPFLAEDGDCVFRAFYKRNPHPNARAPETLQVMMRPGGYCAAANWFRPSRWMPLPKDS